MNAIAAEWIKLRTLRSTFWSLAVAVAGSLAITGLAAPALISQWEAGRPADQAGLRLLVITFMGLLVAQLALSVLGVITMSAEHGSGMIDLTYAATPSRVVVLMAKAAVLAGISLGVFLAIAIPGYLYSRAVAADHDPALLPAEEWSVLAAAPLALVMSSLLGLALGAVLRSGAAALAMVAAVLFVLPLIVVVAVPAPWNERIAAASPLVGELQLLRQAPELMPTWVAFTVSAAYAVIPLAIAALLAARPWRPTGHQAG